MQHTSYANGQAAHQYAKWISCGSLSYLHTYLRLSPAKIRQSSAVRSVTVEQYRNRYHLLIVREIYLFLAFVQSEFHYFLLARRVHRRECTGCISMCVLFARSYGSRTSGRRLEQVTSVTPVVLVELLNLSTTQWVLLTSQWLGTYLNSLSTPKVWRDQWFSVRLFQCQEWPFSSANKSCSPCSRWRCSKRFVFSK